MLMLRAKNERYPAMKKSSVSVIALSAPLVMASGTTLVAGTGETDVWDLLSQIQIEELVSETSYRVNKTWPKGFEGAMEDTRITGYAVPMFPGIPGDSVKDLILTSDIGLCPLCGSPDHGATLQVTLAEPIIGFEDGQRIALTGTLQRVEDAETWQAAIMTGARVISQ